jgi:hypothetical protein
MDVGAWLRGLGLEKYAESFIGHAIGLDVLPDLTDADLKELGIPLGDRKRLLKAAAALRPALAETAPAGAAPAEEPPGGGGRWPCSSPTWPATPRSLGSWTRSSCTTCSKASSRPPTA